MDDRAQSRNRTVAACLGVLAITIAISISSFGWPGPGMDEGRLVAYPELVRSGDVPGRDFESFYGPADPYLVAGAFEVFGSSVDTERAVGLLLRLAIVLAIFCLLLPWGRWPAALGALISASLMYPLGLAALDWFGALAFALLGLALLARAANPETVSSPLLLPAAGLLFAAALLFRPDIALAIALAALPLCLLVGRRELLWGGLGLAIGLLPLLVWLAVVGPDQVSRVVGDLQDSRSGRRLPLPSPVSDAYGQVLFASVFTTVATLVGWAWLGRRSADFRWRLLLSLGLFSLAILPNALQRADSQHILDVGCAIVPVLVVLLVSLWPQLGLGRPRDALRKLAAVAAAGLALLGVVAVVHSFGYAVKSNGLGIGPGGDPISVDVENAGRSYPIETPRVARGLNKLLPEVDAMTAAGDSVFVGPVDLSRTNYADTFLYYLLPDLVPASFYTELNAGTANSSDSTLPDELRDADALLLTNRYANFDDSATGSPNASRVVRREFCLHDSAGGYRLYLRCG